MRSSSLLLALPLVATALAAPLPALAQPTAPSRPDPAEPLPLKPVGEDPAAPATPPPPAQPPSEPKPAAPPAKEPPSSDALATGTAGARAAGSAPPGVGAGFMDTRLSWVFGDDDFLHKTGELVPLSPRFSIGERSQYRLFFDNLNSRFTGRENITHAVMYKKVSLGRLTTEAALVLRFDLAALSANTGNLNTALYDAGSYIRAFYNTNDANAKEGLSAVFFPLDTDRFRLGYLYDISWGGTASSINESIFPRIQGASPGLKVQYDHKDFYLFAGFKTATIVQPEQILTPGGENDVETVRVGETNYGFLGGGGVDILPMLRADLGAGYFQQGKFDLPDVRGRQVYTYGTSARVVVHDHMPVPQSVDFLLYKNDPSAPMILFRPEKYDPNEVAWSVSAEQAVLQQHLSAGGGQLKDQSAMASAVQGVLKLGYARVSLTGIYRNLNFVTRNVPGFIPFETLPANTKTDPELFGALAADYHIADLKLTPGIGGGVQMPATFKSEFTDGSVPASRTIVVRRQGDESILPYNATRKAIFQARLSVRWTLSDMLSAVAWVQYVNDNNATFVVRDPREGSASLRVFQDPHRLGASVAIQARF